MASPTDTRPTILLIEDEAPVRAALAAQRVGLGYDVLAAAPGAAALMLLERTRPSALLVDLMMPVMDGVEFRKRQLTSPALGR